MIVITRFRVAEAAGTEFLARARTAVAAFAACPGYVAGHIGRAADDPGLWVLTTEWVGVGAFRRSLSAFDVKVHAAPLLGDAIDEPAAYEVLETVRGDRAAVITPSDRAPDADTTRIGERPTTQAPHPLT
jgi:quinol monooxygenase YgiN